MWGCVKVNVFAGVYKTTPTITTFLRLHTVYKSNIFTTPLTPESLSVNTL